MFSQQIKVAITGAESTGKSTLSDALANHYRSISVPEFSRSYIENLKRPYTYNDVEFIARKQIEIEKNLLPDKSPVFTWCRCNCIYVEWFKLWISTWLLEYFRFAIGLIATNRDCRDWGWGIICHKPLGFYVSEMVWCVVFAVFGFFTVDSADAISGYSNWATE